MHIEAIDNRRLRRARARLDLQIAAPFGNYEWRLASLVKFTYLLDHQSARIARRIGWRSFAGVPSTAFPHKGPPPMKCRYKNHPEEVRNCSQFNMHAAFEILTGDDSCLPSDLEVFIDDPRLGFSNPASWVCLSLAFKNNWVVPDNLNQFFGPPRDKAAFDRGFNP